MINDMDQIVLEEIHWNANVSFLIDSYHFLYTYIFFRKAEQEILYEREKLEAAFDPQLQKEVCRKKCFA